MAKKVKKTKKRYVTKRRLETDRLLALGRSVDKDHVIVVSYRDGTEPELFSTKDGRMLREFEAEKIMNLGPANLHIDYTLVKVPR